MLGQVPFRQVGIGLVLLQELLEPIGVVFRKTKVGRRTEVDWERPVVPASGDFGHMEVMLRRQQVRLSALPATQRHHVVAMAEVLPGEQAVNRAVCERCVFFHESACAVGVPMEWQSDEGCSGYRINCASFRSFKAELVLV